MANTSNIKTIKKRVEAIHPTIDSSLETIKNSLTPYNFLEVNENGFNKSNVLKDLANNFNKVPKSAPIGKIGNDVMGNEVQNAYPATPDMLKPGVSIVDVENPTQLITSNNNSNTIATDRADGNKDIKRWITRSIFKFREEDYGFDRQVYEIPVKLLMEGIVGVDGRHSTTLQEYPYPEEIVMISQKTDKNFIHFLNVQYSDSHYNYYRGKPYNLMIVKDRIDYGSVNTNGDGFNYYTSVYANNVEESLAFYKDGYLYLSMPDKSFGDELLNTLWDCKIIWRKDAPNREFTIQYNAEELKLFINKNPTWKISNNHISGWWNQICYGNDKFVAVSETGGIFLYSIDGINWTSTRLSNLQWSTITYGNDKFIALAYNSNTVAYSSDGIVWTEGGTGIENRAKFIDVTFGNNKFIAVMSEGNSTIYYSENGINWLKTTSGIPWANYQSVTFGNNKFIAISYERPFIYSTDGINWTSTGNNLTSVSNANVFYGNKKYVVCSNGSSNVIAYSTDGINWLETTEGLGQRNWISGCYGNDKYIIVADNSSIIGYSVDGIYWTEMDNGLGNQPWRDVAYGNSKFVSCMGVNKNIFAYLDESGLKNNIINIYELSGKTQLFEENIHLSPNINSISQLDEFTNPLITNNSISMGLSNNKGSLYRIPNYTTPYDLTFTDELSWSLTNFPNILIPITNKYQLGLNYITGVYSESSVMKNTLYCSLFDNIIHKADPKIKTTGDSNYPCDKLVTNIDSDSHIIKVIPIYSSNIRTDDNNGSIEVMVYTTKKKYKVVFTVTDSVLSFTTTAISTFNGFEIADVKQISSTKAILITSTYNVYLDVIKEDSQTANPFGLSGAITPYLLSKYNIVGINASKVVSSLADCSNTSKFASGINNGAINVVINNSKLSGDGKYFINSGRYSIMKDNSDTNYLVHLKEKYTFSSELDAPLSKNFEWKEINNELSNKAWESVCYGNDKFVAVAYDFNRFAYSTDGINWTETSNGITNSHWRSICYGNGIFVAITSSLNANFIYSTDGINWNDCVGQFDDRAWIEICYGNNEFVAIAVNNPANVYCSYSTDGINWTQRFIGSLEPLRYICYGNGKYVAVSSNAFVYSTDGISWIRTYNNPSEKSWNSVCYGNDKYVAVSTDPIYNTSNIFAYSTDGINWTETSNGLGERDWNSVCYGNGKYVAISTFNSNIFAYSTDGINWTETSNGIITQGWSFICYGNNKYVVLKKNSNMIAYSDGIII